MKNSEKGQAFPLAIMALVFGTLVITPFLGHASSSLISSRTYEQGINELYACDSGIEYGIWSLQSGALVLSENETGTLPGFILNSQDVAVSVENLGSSVYRVMATATGEDGHSMTIASRVLFGGGWSSDGDIDTDTGGDVYVDGDAVIGGNVKVDGSVFATGDVDLDNNAVVTGDVIAGGNMELRNNAVIGGDVAAGGDLALKNNSGIGSIEVGGNVCAGGNIYLANNTIIYGSVSTTGNIDMSGNAIIKGDVFIGNTIAAITLDNNARIEGNVYITGSITSKISLAANARIYEDVDATGTINNIVREGNILGDVHENYAQAYPPHPD